MTIEAQNLTVESFQAMIQSDSSEEEKKLSTFKALSNFTAEDLKENMNGELALKIDAYAKERTSLIREGVKAFINYVDARSDLYEDSETYVAMKNAHKEACSSYISLYFTEKSAVEHLRPMVKSIGERAAHRFSSVEKSPFYVCSVAPRKLTLDAIYLMKNMQAESKDLEKRKEELLNLFVNSMFDNEEEEIKFLYSQCEENNIFSGENSFKKEIAESQINAAKEKIKAIKLKRELEKEDKIKKCESSILANMELLQKHYSKLTEENDSNYLQYKQLKRLAIDKLENLRSFCSDEELFHHKRLTNIEESSYLMNKLIRKMDDTK